jgi:hypothetical protein
MTPNDKNAPATRGDVQEIVNQLEERLTDRMRDMQTEVLRAFANWARPTEIKLRSS